MEFGINRLERPLYTIAPRMADNRSLLSKMAGRCGSAAPLSRRAPPFPGVSTFHAEVNRLQTLPPLSASPPAPWKGSAFPSASHPLLFLARRGCASPGPHRGPRHTISPRSHEASREIVSMKGWEAQPPERNKHGERHGKAEPFHGAAGGALPAPDKHDPTDASPGNAENSWERQAFPQVRGRQSQPA